MDDTSHLAEQPAVQLPLQALARSSVEQALDGADDRVVSAEAVAEDAHPVVLQHLQGVLQRGHPGVVPVEDGRPGGAELSLQLADDQPAEGRLQVGTSA